MTCHREHWIWPRTPGLGSLVSYLLAGWPWANPFTPCASVFVFIKMEITNHTSQNCLRTTFLWPLFIMICKVWISAFWLEGLPQSNRLTMIIIYYLGLLGLKADHHFVFGFYLDVSLLKTWEEKKNVKGYPDNINHGSQPRVSGVTRWVV